MQKELSLVKNKIREWIKKHDAIDVVLFGSSVRDKINPNDADLCIIIRDDEEKKSIDLVDSLGKLIRGNRINAHINILTEKEFISGNTLTKTIISEGFSIKNSKKVSSILGFNNSSLFNYSLRDFTPSKRVKFHYVLRGRYGRKGILKETDGKFLGSGTIMVPTEKEDHLKEVFDLWEIKYKINRILLG